MKKYKAIMFIVVLIACLAINLKIDEKNMLTDLSLKSLSLTAFADPEGVPACVTITYYAKNMKQGQIGSACYDSSGTQCGTQACCVSTSAYSSCNEYSCN